MKHFYSSSKKRTGYMGESFTHLFGGIGVASASAMSCENQLQPSAPFSFFQPAMAKPEIFGPPYTHGLSTRVHTSDGGTGIAALTLTAKLESNNSRLFMRNPNTSEVYAQ